MRAEPARSHATRHLRAGFAVLAGLTGIGTLGFRWLADMSWIDAMYMTVTTLATVGYGEIQPLDATARVFTSVLIVAGVGATLYTVGALAEFVIAGRITELIGRRAMNRALAALRDHVIVCGYGRLGRALGAELAKNGVPLVVVEEDRELAARLEGEGLPVLCASAVDEGVLEQAGVTRARALVAATGSEAVNVFIALAAREANPGLAIHARAESDAGARRLHSAGAQTVVSPHRLGGQRLAHAILRPAVVEFVELAAPGSGVPIDLEEVAVAADSQLAGRRVADLGEHGVRVVAIRRGSEPLLLNPTTQAEIRAGDRVVVVGDRRSVDRLAELAAPTRG
jgi:voltage-gated potassium channel